MSIFNILSLLGGLALFLYGMTVMGDSLNHISSGKFEAVLSRLTSNPIKAVLLGTGITAIIQSSSATTVMVVGFVNAGILHLEQSVGIIMGANIGTTVTSWLLSLTGIHGDQLWIRLLEPKSFSPALAFIGIVLLLFSRAEQKHDLGRILLGFAILMTGMTSMSNSVAPLADVPAFTRFMTMFSNPVLGMLAGAVITAIIQSSSASVGILQALCVTGTIPYTVVLPVIMGQNIGTCVTALISAIGANRNSKRTALIHLYFNLIGTCTFLIIFYSVNYFYSFPFLNQYASAAGIAVIHSTFNIFATIILLPFSKGLVKLSYLTLPVMDEEPKHIDTCLNLLDQRFLETPTFALEQAKSVFLHIVGNIELLDQQIYPLFHTYRQENYEQCQSLFESIQCELQALNEYLLQISGCRLNPKDNQLLNHLLLHQNELKQIAEQYVQISHIAKKLHKKDCQFSRSANEEVDEIWHMTTLILQNLKTPFDMGISDFNIQDSIRKFKKNTKQYKKNHMKRLRKGKCTTEIGICYLDLLSDFQQIYLHSVTVLEDTCCQ